MPPADEPPYILKILRLSFTRGPLNCLAFWWPVWFPAVVLLIWKCEHGSP